MTREAFIKNNRKQFGLQTKGGTPPPRFGSISGFFLQAFPVILQGVWLGYTPKASFNPKNGSKNLRGHVVSRVVTKIGAKSVKINYIIGRVYTYVCGNRCTFSYIFSFNMATPILFQVSTLSNFQYFQKWVQNRYTFRECTEQNRQTDRQTLSD